jgi:hypothetical protein
MAARGHVAPCRGRIWIEPSSPKSLVQPCPCERHLDLPECRRAGGAPTESGLRLRFHIDTEARGPSSSAIARVSPIAVLGSLLRVSHVMDHVRRLHPVYFFCGFFYQSLASDAATSLSVTGSGPGDGLLTRFRHPMRGTDRVHLLVRAGR